MFCKNLKYYRLKNNMSRKELASLAGISPMSVSYYENGERRPGMDTIKKLAEVLGVKVTDFLSSRDDSLNLSMENFGKRLSCR